MSDENTTPAMQWVKIVGGGMLTLLGMGGSYIIGSYQRDAVLETKVRNEWERKNESEMQPLKRRLAEVDAKLKEIQARESTSKGDLVAIEAAKAKSPTYVVKPSIRQSLSVNDIREIDLDIVIDNIGSVPVAIADLEIGVFIATPNEDVKGLIARTQEMSRDSEYLEQLRLVNYEESIVRSEEMNRRWNEQELGCPHGLLFAIDTESKDVDWREVSELTRRVPLSVEVYPGASAMKSFKYLLTEYPDQHHRQWLRFRVQTNGRASSGSQVYEFIVSGQPLEESTAGNRSVTTTVLKAWEPTAPLVPVPPDSGPYRLEAPSLIPKPQFQPMSGQQ